MLSQSKFSQKSGGPSAAARRAYMGKSAAIRIQKFVRARQSRDRKVSGGVKRGGRGAARPVRLYNNPLSHVVLPDRVEVSMVTCMDAYWVAGRMTAAAGNYFSVLVNSIVSPFSTPTLYMTAPTTTYSFASNAQLVQGFVITNNPLGYNTISPVYQNYRVMKYELEITVTPATGTDVLRLVTMPLGQEEIPSATAGSTNLRVLEEQPYALAKTCSSGTAAGPGANNTLRLSGAPYKDLGLTREQYLASGNQTLISAQPNNTIADYAGVFCQQLNGSNNASPVTVQCKLTQVVILESVSALIA